MDYRPLVRRLDGTVCLLREGMLVVLLVLFLRAIVTSSRPRPAIT